MDHQYMPKMFHDPHRNSPAPHPSPSYILNVWSLTTKHPNQRTVLAVLHKVSVCVVKDSLLFIVLPSSLTSILHLNSIIFYYQCNFAIINKFL